MTGSQRSELVSTILQFVGDTGLRMGAKNHVHWLAETVACIYIIIYTMEIIAVVNVRHDSIKFFEYIKDLSLGGIGIIKLISLRRNHHRWHLLLEKATNIEKDQLEWQSKCENDSKDDSFAFSEYISDYSKKFQLTSKVLSYTYKITLVVYVSSPFLEYGYRKFFGGGTDDLPHILPSCSPLDDYSFAGYSSINQGQGPYGAAYWSLSPGVRKQLTILAMGMSSPCKLYAGPFISLNLPSFVQVLRTAYSYYALIKNKK
ncbi:unnamed protein product [Diatraea saccharalis]|uniref:Odorant receptor n=1 Tax=Diatraea saccharalis TaxID=40085 RepID=A0A9N9WAI0_9NEOP|nr:unnamed protein product [Diatraea saccharalis]